MAKPTPKRLGLLRLARDHSTDEIPLYPFNMNWMQLSSYCLSDEDINVIHAAVRAGLLREHKGCFYFLTDAGKLVLEKYKDYLPQIPGKYGIRPKIGGPK